MNAVAYQDSKLVLKLPLTVIDTAVAADGGTVYYSIQDSTGKQHDIYVDGRIGAESRGAVFYGGYPGSTGSVALEKQEEFKQNLLPELIEQAKKLD